LFVKQGSIAAHGYNSFQQYAPVEVENAVDKGLGAFYGCFQLQNRWAILYNVPKVFRT